MPIFDLETPAELGVALAEMHRDGRAAAPPLVGFSERPHVQDWSMRAALVRYAQRQPIRASAVLELVRRVDSALHPDARLIERSPRLSDLGRAHRRWADDFATLLDAYLGVDDSFSPEEDSLIPLLSVAAELDDLGSELARWAVTARGPRPDDAVDRTCRSVNRRLDDLGVPKEQRRPPGR